MYRVAVDIPNVHTPETARVADHWPRYEPWNAAIAQEFFGGRWGGRPVYLDLEDDVRERIEQAAHATDTEGAPDLIAAVRPTLRLAERGSLFGLHVARLKRWRLGPQQEPPPVLGVLALLSLVAEQMHTDSEFSASNYYGRFVQLLGADPSDDTLHQKVERGFATESHLLWRALNDWLSEQPDVRGIPTAYAFDFRVHVGVPMSQALVREPDRRRLQELFADARLRPGERLSHSDMLRLLRQWIPASAVSRTLKVLCEQPEVLERVAEVACVELEAWGGQLDVTAPLTRSELALFAHLRAVPRRRLDLSLAARLPTGPNDDLLVLDADSGPAATNALERVEGRLELAPPDEDGWRAVSNAGEVAIADLLLATMQLTTPAGARIRRIPRRLILLERDETMLRFAEVPRARLGSEYVLLAMDALQSDLAAALQEAARPGYRAIRPKFLPGLPAGWTAYLGVELIGITTSNHPDLASLIPVAWSQASFSGGLKLPGRGCWHQGAPPSLNATSYAGQPVEAILHREVVDADTEHDQAEETLLLGVIDGADVLDLSSLGLNNGRYRAALVTIDEARVIGSTPLQLRSASESEGAPSEGAGTPLDEPASAVFGRWATTGARGAEWDEAATFDTEQAAAPVSPLAALPGLTADEEEDEPLPPVAPTPQPASVANCLETGAHYFLLDEHAGRRGLADMFGGDCRYCGLEKFFPARPRRGKKRHRRRSAGDRRAAQLHDIARSLECVPRRSDPQRTDANVMLDALSLIGAGSWEVLQRLIGQHDDRPWAVMETARTLASLGHLDLVIDRSTVRPARWSIALATIVVTQTDAFLAGFRSHRLIDALVNHAERHGLHVTRTAIHDAPDRISVSPCSAADAHQLAAEVRVEDQLQLGVADRPADRIAGWLPSLEDLRLRLPLDDVMPHEGLERFSPATGQWEPAASTRADGAYRTTRFPRRHWHRSGAECRRSLDPLSKWLAAAGVQPLLAYDPATQQLVCHVGCPLPGLHERAAVLTSGQSASLAGRHLVYEGVDERLAAILARKLHVPVADGAA